MRRSGCAFVVLCFFPPVAAAQLTRPQAPALARAEALPVKPAKPGDALKLVVTVTPREGIHIYAPPQKEFRPITLVMDVAPGVKIAKPKLPPATTRTFEGEPVKVYDRAFSITIPVVLSQRARGTTTLTGTLTYQACDDLVCYRPVPIRLRWDIHIQ